MKAPVTSGHSSWQSDKKGASTTTLPRSPASDTVCPSWLTSALCCGVGSLRMRPWDAGGAAGASEPQAPRSAGESREQDDDRGRAGGTQGQVSSSPGGRKVKGRSARVISVEAIQRVRSSKTGVMVVVSSSCCSLKRMEPS